LLPTIFAAEEYTLYVCLGLCYTFHEIAASARCGEAAIDRIAGGGAESATAPRPTGQREGGDVQANLAYDGGGIAAGPNLRKIVGKFRELVK
jgi:hypothetical protein